MPDEDATPATKSRSPTMQASGSSFHVEYEQARDMFSQNQPDVHASR